ncbi:tripartite motif-containing protein 16-like [Scleropages formosus]|uniref:Tripartite motif-containing protein 16-like n=2 Tax=Scleropages formosus TaxID=113540 RepID=A0A0P7W539_SCLFO|nr:tripartite motif-containing protein 16-like [Scleropages formosus]
MASLQLIEDHISCPICLNSLSDPATLPCGHNYCMECITKFWDKEGHPERCCCPQCLRTFHPRPELSKNIMLAEVAEELKKKGLLSQSPTHSCAGPEDVPCDCCLMDRKLKAVKSCLVCLASYCQTHLEPHMNVPALQWHELVDATLHIQQKICSIHNKVLDIYCEEDEECICYMCTRENHAGHDTISPMEARANKKDDVTETQNQFKKRIQKMESKLQELKFRQNAGVDCDKVFSQLKELIEQLHSEVRKKIEEQEKTVVGQAKKAREQLQNKIEKLKGREGQLESLSHTQDHILFLQTWKSLCNQNDDQSPASLRIHPYPSFWDMKISLIEMKEKVERVCRQETNEICQRDSWPFTLDLGTVSKYISISEGNRKISVRSKGHQSQRFQRWELMLCKEAITDVCCYWEVEWSGQDVLIGVTYNNLIRKAKTPDCDFGFNAWSWSLQCTDTSYTAWHDNQKNEVANPVASPWVGVYLDHKAGSLAFYSISNRVTLLHRFRTSFSKPLYPCFGVGFGSALKLCHLQVE